MSMQDALPAVSMLHTEVYQRQHIICIQHSRHAQALLMCMVVWVHAAELQHACGIVLCQPQCRCGSAVSHAYTLPTF